MEKHFGQWLKRQIDDLGVSQTAFAQQHGIPHPTLKGWIASSRPRIRGYNLTLLATALKHKRHIVEETLLGAEPDEFDANVEPYSERRLKPIPLFDLPLSAGTWTEVTQIAELHEADQIDRGIFRVRLRGDSMLPDYKSGTVVEFRCLRADENVIKIGKDYYVQRNDGTATFKRVAELTEDEMILRALNQRKYPKPMPVARQEVTRMALAIARVELL